MSTDDRKHSDPLNEEPVKPAASLQPGPKVPATGAPLKPLDLGAAASKPKNIVSARIGIPHDRYVGTGSILAAGALIETASKCRLKNPLPAALELFPGASEERILHGIPRDEQGSAWLNLTWFDQGRYFRANFRDLLALLKIKIPDGTRMVINVASEHDERLGPCVKLWWESDCFVPIDFEDEV